MGIDGSVAPPGAIVDVLWNKDRRWRRVRWDPVGAVLRQGFVTVAGHWTSREDEAFTIPAADVLAWRYPTMFAVADTRNDGAAERRDAEAAV